MMILSVQTGVLQAAGILPSLASNTVRKGQRKTSVCYFIVTFCAGWFLIGILLSCCIRTTHFLYDVIRSTPATTARITYNSDVFLKIIQLVPFTAINWRTLITLLLVFRKRSKWSILIGQLQTFVQKNFDSPALIERKAGRFGVILCVATVGLHTVWEVDEWLVYLNDLSNDTLYGNNFWTPIPIPMDVFGAAVIWTVFCTIPFIISQQILVAVVTVAFVISQALTELTRKIQTEITFFQQGNSRSFVMVVDQETALLEERVRKWQCGHMEILIFFGRVNRYFSSFLFVFYSLNIVTVLGFVANLIANSRSDTQSYIYLIGSSLIFFSYGTVFLIPLISVYEKVSANFSE